MSTILPHMMRHLCEFRMHVWNVLHVARWKYRTQKVAIYAHLTTLLGYIFATMACINDPKKKLVKQQYLLHMSSQYGELWSLMAETGWQVWDTSANFNGFCILASLLQRCHSTVVNQTLHMFGHLLALAPWQNFARCKIHFAFKFWLLYWQRYWMALEQWQGGHHAGHQPTF